MSDDPYVPGIDLQLVSFQSLSVKTAVTSRQLMPLPAMGPESHTLWWVIVHRQWLLSGALSLASYEDKCPL